MVVVANLDDPVHDGPIFLTFKVKSNNAAYKLLMPSTLQKKRRKSETCQGQGQALPLVKMLLIEG